MDDEECRKQLNALAAYLMEREYISLLLTGQLTDAGSEAWAAAQSSDGE